MYRRGIVTRVDAATCRARVCFPDRDNVESWWLEVLQGKTLRDKEWWVPDVGETVACLMDEGSEAGAILGSLYGGSVQPPVTDVEKHHIRYQDGAMMEYDRSTHVMTVELPASGVFRLVIGGSVLEISAGGWVVQTADVDWTTGGS